MKSIRQHKKQSALINDSGSSSLTKPVIIPRKQYFVYYWEWTKWHQFNEADRLGQKFCYDTREEAEQAIVDYCEKYHWRFCHWKIEETLRNPFYDSKPKEQ
jgi:hypothetical protein